MKKVGYLGPRGTFTEAAAQKYCGGSPAELVCCPGLPEIVAAVEGGQLDQGVVPLENSTEGAVGQLLDLVARASGIMFCGEVVLRVQHHLMVRPGTPRSRISRVLSHPQALAQCRNYLARQLPGTDAEETVSTARAAELVAACGEPWAAIGTHLAAVNHGLEILDSGIQDSVENATRFIVLGRQDAEQEPHCRTSLVVEVRDRPGALYGILREFALREVNLTRIESRPVKKRLGQYLFFIDLEGHRSQEAVKSAIQSVQRKAANLKVLGSYPRDLEAESADPAGPAQILSDIGEIRSEIDLVDSQIVDLIAIRAALVEKIGPMKRDPASVRDPAREEQVLDRVRAVAAEKGADPELIGDIFRYMISRSVERQKDVLRNSSIH